MPLTAGEQIAQYKILSLIGAGGMGEVYRATDTKLKREVAIKVLSAAVARDPARMLRFQREAEMLASLNHPNIAAIYGVEENALVMELVEGESPKGPLEFAEAWKVASQIAAALEYAHDRGVMHRDLKPANVRVTPEGVVKLLDFGLAKAMDTRAESSVDPENSPTLTIGMTEAGVILGTAAYMAPEQAKGKKVDKRADIWAFGVVLWELLTGERLFKAEDASETLALVLTKQPDYEQVPPIAGHLLRECLQKDLRLRLRDIGDAKRLLIDESSGALPPAPGHRTATLRERTMPILAAAFALATIALGVTLWSPWRVAPEPPRPVRFQIAPPEKLTLGIGFALSPDGTKLAFQASGTDGVLRLWVRSMDALEARPLPGTEGNLPAPIFWSFDSRFVTYDGGGKLKKVDVAGGPPQTLCDASNVVVGGSWNRDGVVLFGVNSGLIQRVSSAGGTPTPVTGLNPSLKATTTLFPVFLPDQRHFLYWAGGGGPGEQGIYVGSIDSKPEQQSSKRLLATEFGAVLAPSTESNRVEVLFLRDGTVMAQALDLTHMEMTGEATPVAEQVGSYLALGFVSASATGALAYRSGGGGSGTVLGLLDRQGKSLGTAGDPRAYLRLALPPTKTALP